MKFVLVLLLVACFLKISQAVIGVDVSSLFSESTYTCMKTNSAQFAVVRGYCSYGGVDSNAVSNLKNAKSAGLITDIYMFPCAIGKAASTQASELASAIPSSLYGMVWVDVETNPSSGCGWQSATANCQFLSDLISALKGHGMHVGVYSSEYMWESLFGSKTACTDFTSEQLWYAHYDDSESFSDYTEFGGWTKPSIKQYKGDTTLCSAGVDMDYYP